MRKSKILAILLVFAFTGCGKEQPSASPAAEQTAALTETTTELYIEASSEIQTETASEVRVNTLDFQEIPAVTSEEEALSVLTQKCQTTDSLITFRYCGTDHNDVETWYDFVECYNDIPVWGRIIRIHAYEKNTYIQGDVILSGFALGKSLLTGDEALKAYSKEVKLNLKDFICVETCYLYQESSETLPLCYHYSSEYRELFLNAETGQLEGSRDNIIIG